MATVDGSEQLHSRIGQLAAQKERELKQINDLRLGTMEQCIKDKEDEIEAHRIRFDKMKADFTYNLKILEERDEELQKYDETFAQYKKMMSDKEQELSECKVTNADLTQTVTDLEEKLRETETRATDLITSLKDQLEDALLAREQMQRKAESELDALRRSLQHQTDDLAETLATQRRELSRAFEDAQTERDCTWRSVQAKLEDELRTKETLLNQAQRELQLVQDANGRLKDQLESAENRARAAESKWQQASWVVKEGQRDLQSEIVKLQSRGETLERLRESEIRDHHEQRDRLQAQVQALEARIKRMGEDHEAQVEMIRAEMMKSAQHRERDASDRQRVLTERNQFLVDELEKHRALVRRYELEKEQLDRFRSLDNRATQELLEKERVSNDTEMKATKMLVWEKDREIQRLREAAGEGGSQQANSAWSALNAKYDELRKENERQKRYISELKKHAESRRGSVAPSESGSFAQAARSARLQQQQQQQQQENASLAAGAGGASGRQSERPAGLSINPQLSPSESVPQGSPLNDLRWRPQFAGDLGPASPVHSLAPTALSPHLPPPQPQEANLAVKTSSAHSDIELAAAGAAAGVRAGTGDAGGVSQLTDRENAALRHIISEMRKEMEAMQNVINQQAAAAETASNVQQAQLHTPKASVPQPVSPRPKLEQRQSASSPVSQLRSELKEIRDQNMEMHRKLMEVAQNKATSRMSHGRPHASHSHERKTSRHQSSRRRAKPESPRSTSGSDLDVSASNARDDDNDDNYDSQSNKSGDTAQLQQQLKETRRRLQQVVDEREKLMDISSMLKADLTKALAKSYATNPAPPNTVAETLEAEGSTTRAATLAKPADSASTVVRSPSKTSAPRRHTSSTRPSRRSNPWLDGADLSQARNKAMALKQAGGEMSGFEPIPPITALRASDSTTAVEPIGFSRYESALDGVIKRTADPGLVLATPPLYGPPTESRPYDDYSTGLRSALYEHQELQDELRKMTTPTSAYQ